MKILSWVYKKCRTLCRSFNKLSFVLLCCCLCKNSPSCETLKKTSEVSKKILLTSRLQEKGYNRKFYISGHEIDIRCWTRECHEIKPD